jgi:hypothetical protein
MWRRPPISHGRVLVNNKSDLKIADRELARKKEVERILDYIYRQLGQLGVINNLPDSGVRPIALMNRALDVKSAAMTYIAVHIIHESNRLGIIGRICS